MVAGGNGTGQVDAARDEVARLEIALLIDVLPERLAAAFRRDVPPEALLEIVLDLGRSPEARLTDGVRRLDDDVVGREDLVHVLGRTGPVGGDNRAGIERTLHRISALRNRSGEIVGLTLRVGRAVFGTVDMIRDLVESGRNLLLLGRPGVGKTTKLRELARVLADDFERRVVIVDTSNEIGGDGDVPHPGIGRARRMQVPRPSAQHDVMIEAVENHMPEAIIVDEIGTQLEAAAARTIAERGVQLVATAHGTTLENLVLNPTLSDLVGGTHTVTLSDDEARRRRTPKTITERRGVPTFDAVVEIVDRREVVCHVDTAEAVDRLLAGQPIGGERRQMVAGRMEVHTAEPAYPDGFEGEEAEAGPALATLAPLACRRDGVLRVAVLGVSHDLLRRVLEDLDLKARIMAEPDGADLMLALRDRARERGVKLAAARGVPVYTLKKNSSAEMKRVLRSALAVVGGAEDEDVREAVLEAEHAIARVVSEGVPVSLAPRSPSLRKVQHRLISRHHLESESAGREPFRHLVVYPPALA